MHHGENELRYLHFNKDGYSLKKKTIDNVLFYSTKICYESLAEKASLA